MAVVTRIESQNFGYQMIGEYLENYVFEESKFSPKMFLLFAFKSKWAPEAFRAILNNISSHGLINDRFGKIVMKSIKKCLLEKRKMAIRGGEINPPEFIQVVNEYEIPDQYIGHELTASHSVLYI